MENPKAILNDFLVKMRPYLIAAGIPKEQINVRKGNHKVDTYLKAFDWLHDLFMSEDYRHHIYVWDLVTPEIWASYAALQITGLREQDMLAESSKTIRKLWKTRRPQVIGRNKRARNKKKD
jgi:hypothetical protein